MKIRIKFAKYGTMKFIGHLDMMRFLKKAHHIQMTDKFHDAVFGEFDSDFHRLPLSTHNMLQIEQDSFMYVFRNTIPVLG